MATRVAVAPGILPVSITSGSSSGKPVPGRAEWMGHRERSEAISYAGVEIASPAFAGQALAGSSQ
jgi:hypothetical protein